MRHTLLLSAILFIAAPASAQVVSDTSDVVMGFDDVVEEPPAAGGADDGIHISGRFDLNLETENPGDDGVSRLRNYHSFVFLKATPTDKVTLDAEIVGLSYYEMGYALPRGFTLRMGKIWVPFGATPFHHYYGGVQGDPFTGLLLPNVWAEFGATVGGSLFQGDMFSAESDLYVIRGFDGQLGSVLRFNSGSDDVYAYGGRLKLAYGTGLAAWGSVQYNTFGGDEDEGELLLWGADLLVDYGTVDLPILEDLRLRAAFARADIKDPVLVDPAANADGWYFRYGDYAELTYRGFKYAHPRVRYGTIIDFDDVVSDRDSHNWNFALMTRIASNLSVLAEYQVNLEEVNERDNDLFRLQFVLEF